jgi:hypothetical protein
LRVRYSLASFLEMTSSTQVPANDPQSPARMMCFPEAFLPMEPIPAGMCFAAFGVPPMEPRAGICFSNRAGVFASCWGDCHVAWNDTRHHPDHFLLGGFSGRFGGYGYGMGHSAMGSAA